MKTLILRPPHNLHTGDVIAPDGWQTWRGETVPVKDPGGQVIGQAVIDEDEQGFLFRVTLDNEPALDFALEPVGHEWCRSVEAVKEGSFLKWCHKCGCPGDHEDARLSCPGRHLYRYEAGFSNTSERPIVYIKIPYRQEDIW